MGRDLRLFTASLVCGLLALIAGTAGAQQMDAVLFSYKKITVTKDQPPVLQVVIKVNDHPDVALFSVESIKGHPAEERAAAITSRFQQAWDVTRDRALFAGGLTVGHSLEFDAWILEPTRRIGPMPDHMLQIDGIVGPSFADTDTDVDILTHILHLIRNALRGVDYPAKELTAVTMEDMAQLALDKCKQAGDADDDARKLALLHEALLADGDCLPAYRLLAKCYKDRKDSHAAECAALLQRLEACQALRATVRDALANGKGNIALAQMAKARDLFPQAIWNYWMLSRCYEKTNQLAEAIRVLDQGEQELTGKMRFGDIPLYDGLWPDLFLVRKGLLRAKIIK